MNNNMLVSGIFAFCFGLIFIFKKPWQKIFAIYEMFNIKKFNAWPNEIYNLYIFGMRFAAFCCLFIGPYLIALSLFGDKTNKFLNSNAIVLAIIPIAVVLAFVLIGYFLVRFNIKKIFIGMFLLVIFAALSSLGEQNAGRKLIQIYVKKTIIISFVLSLVGFIVLICKNTFLQRYEKKISGNIEKENAVKIKNSSITFMGWGLIVCGILVCFVSICRLFFKEICEIIFVFIMIGSLLVAWGFVIARLVKVARIKKKD